MKWLVLFSVFVFGKMSLAAEYKTLFAPEDDVKREILSTLKEAKKTVDISMYSFSDENVRAFLKELGEDAQGLSGKKIRIRLLLDGKQFKTEGQKKICNWCDLLELSGVDVRRLNISNHQKFAVIDGENLLTGSGNWSHSAFTRYDEDLLSVKGPSQMVDEFQREFDYLWKYSLPFGADLYHDVRMEVEPLSRDRVTVFTSENFVPRNGKFYRKSRVRKDPSDGVSGKTIVYLIDAARYRIQVATAHLRRKDIYNALTRALERGVDVQLVTDQQEFSSFVESCDDAHISSKHLDECLARKGAHVRWKTYMTKWNYRSAPQMHLKYIVVDDKVGLTGSFNYSYTAEISKFETLYYMPDVEPFLSNFEKVFHYEKISYSELLERVKTKKVCRWPEVSLNYEQFKTIRSHLNFKSCG